MNETINYRNMYIRFENTIIKHKYHNHILYIIYYHILILNIFLKFQCFKFSNYKFSIF